MGSRAIRIPADQPHPAPEAARRCGLSSGNAGATGSGATGSAATSAITTHVLDTARGLPPGGGAVPACFPEVTVTFRVGGEARHHHVPLLLSPFAYSTYRGS